MELDEIVISRAIIETYTKKLTACLDLDVAVVGGGPAGLVAGHFLAKEGFRVALFEKKLSIGGGMWGGGMMFNEIVVQEDARQLLDYFGVTSSRFSPGYYTADSILTVSSLTAAASRAGSTIFNLISVEDVMVREDRVTGLVILWTATGMAGLHVDPVTVRARYVIDATGHDAQIVRIIERKSGGRLLTDTGSVKGERSMWADVAETTTLENTREVYPGVYVAGMSANAVFGSYRMGPVFGGMLLSGERAASLVTQRLRQEG
jgi:thiazole biosynthesis enzyme